VAETKDSPRTKIRIGLAGKTREIEVTLPPGDPAPYPEGPRRVTGTRRPRLDGPQKVTGRALFTHDVRKEGLLFGRILRSPHAHARVVSIDTSRLSKIPGIVFEIPEKREVRYQGDPVLALAAPTPEAADDALRAVEVKYEVLPHVVDLLAAMKPDAPLVFEKAIQERRTAGDAPGGGGSVPQRGNIRGPKSSGRGDVTMGFAEADGTLELTTRTTVQTHVCLETHSTAAEWSGDTLTVHASTQGTFSVRDELAHVLDLREDRVHVLSEFLGGGFGSKFGAGDYGVFAAKLAKKAGRPVKLLLDRKEEHLAAGNRPDSLNTVKIGFRKDGAITALEYTSFGTAGVATGAGTGSFAKNAYDFPNVKVEESDVFTHLGPGCAMRAPGHPQGCFAVESALDAVAEKLGLDPLAVRLKNERSEVRLAEWDAGAKEIRWSRRAALTKANRAAAAAGNPLRRGLGCAGSVWYTITDKGPQALVRVHRDGAVEVENGVQDIGGGIGTPMAMVVAEELGLPVEAIRVKIGDSRYPYGPASGGSKTTDSLIPAVRAAAVHAARKLAEVAAVALGTSADQVAIGEGAFTAGGNSVEWKRVCSRMPGDSVVATGDRAPDYEGMDPRIFGVQFAEVIVDTETGIVKVEKVVAVHDCGLPVWRTGVESQIYGGVLQGISYALFEERIVDERNGRFMNPNVEFYKILGAKDVPEIVPIVLDVYAGKNNAHVRGIGEPATIPTSAAVANAVSHALGVRITELPITPARVLAAVAGREEARS
jgi:xanthine dehydrogenase YagR molybdenum-binding subunit